MSWDRERLRNMLEPLVELERRPEIASLLGLVEDLAEAESSGTTERAKELDAQIREALTELGEHDLEVLANVGDVDAVWNRLVKFVLQKGDEDQSEPHV